MAQNREQRYATAADMRRALHEAEQASTVVDRAEAQTVLFPTPPPKTVPVSTQTVAVAQTVGPTSETTVVRSPSRGPRRLVPLAISAAVLVLVACGALGFYALKKQNNEQNIQIATESPTPLGGTVAASPSPSPEGTASVTAEAATTPKKPEKTARNEEAKKAPTPEKRQSPQVQVEVQGHEEDQPPDVPVPPNFDPQNRPRRPNVRVMPGGVKIQTLPDGSQIITTPDGGRFMINKDGTRTVLSPPRRRRPTPAPTPEP
jgi:hypothetical protein